MLNIHKRIKGLKKKYEPKHDLYSLGLLIDSVAEKFQKDKSSLKEIQRKLFNYEYQNAAELLRDLLTLES